MLIDSHVHTIHSADSDAPVATMIQRAIELGMKKICITDHHDFDYPYDSFDFCMDAPAYYFDMLKWREYFKEQIQVIIGVEVGIEPYLSQRLDSFVNATPFDFVIGSSHIIHRMDPYYPEFFENRKDIDCFKDYFESILENLKVFTNFDVYGHLDYIVRYAPQKDKNFSYPMFFDLIDEILKKLISLGKGIECNTGGYLKMSSPNPHPDIIKRYRELGGEIITVGSDAHCSQNLGGHFSQAAAILKECGFRYYTVFQQRIPEFIPLD